MTAVAPARVSYRQVLGVPEFRALFVADVLSILGDQVTRIAVALLVYDRTGSAFAASATYACSFLTWIVGGPVLSVLADRYPRRELMITTDVVRMLLVLVMCVPGLPLAGLFVCLAGVGLLTPPFEAARSALLADVLEGEIYVTGNALMNTFAQGGQVAGFLLGGTLVAALGARGALSVDATTFAVSAVLVGVGVRHRDGNAPTATRIWEEAREGLHLVVRTPELRRLLAYAAIASGVLIVPEGLSVPIARGAGGGPVAAGVLTAAVPAGFILGAWLVLRVPEERRRALLPRLVLGICLPLLLTPLVGSIAPVTALWVVAGMGGAMQIIANAAFVTAVPAHLRGRAYGVGSTCLMVTQGAALVVSGAVAEASSPRAAVAVAGFAGLACLSGLSATGTPGRHSRRRRIGRRSSR